MKLLKWDLHFLNQFVNQQFKVNILNWKLAFVNTVCNVFEECHNALVIIEFHYFVLDLYQNFLVIFLIYIKQFVGALTFTIDEIFYFVCECPWLYYSWYRSENIFWYKVFQLKDFTVFKQVNLINYTFGFYYLGLH